jgi:hypothetical protein
MNKLFQNKPFKIGFLIGILTIVGLSIYTFYHSEYCKYALQCAGFPLSFYEKFLTKCELIAGEGVAIDCFSWHFSWSGAFIDFLVAIILGFIVGFVYKFDYGRFGTKNLDK